MATKQVILSDLSGTELDDSTHTRVIVRHPDLNFPVSLDISTDEAAKLSNTTLRLVEFDIHEPNKPVRKALIETKALDKLFPKVAFDDVLAGAPKAEVKTAAAAPRKAATKSSGERIDPTAPDQFGRLRRGRLTEAEKELVRANPEQASKNRQAQGHPPIDWSSEVEKKRYGIE